MSIKTSPPTLKIVPLEHFWIQGLKRGFELSALLPIYTYVFKNLGQIERDKDLELTIGSSTIVYRVNSNNDICLITGWVGNRKKSNNKL